MLSRPNGATSRDPLSCYCRLMVLFFVSSDGSCWWRRRRMHYYLTIRLRVHRRPGPSCFSRESNDITTSSVMRSSSPSLSLCFFVLMYHKEEEEEEVLLFVSHGPTLVITLLYSLSPSIRQQNRYLSTQFWAFERHISLAVNSPLSLVSN